MSATRFLYFSVILIFANPLFSKFVIAPERALDCAITYIPPSVEGGRFGDHVVAYCKTKYYSLKYNLPLLYKPFHLSDRLVLHTKEMICSHMHSAHFQHHVTVNCEADIINNWHPGTLFVASAYTSLNLHAPIDNNQPPAVPKSTFFWIDDIYEKMIQEPIFFNTVREMLQPLSKMPTPEIPAGHISVALHVRRGGGFDGPLGSAQYLDQIAFVPPIYTVVTDKKFPLKFPPEQFFIDQLVALSEALHDEPLFIQLFTDDLKASELLQRLKYRCKKTNIVWSYNPTVWTYTTLEEIFAMTHFDCLIRSCSHFGGIAHLLGNHKIVIWPTDYEWQANYLNILGTSILLNNRGVYTTYQSLAAVGYENLTALFADRE
jgi:hypothetical protein